MQTLHVRAWYSLVHKHKHKHKHKHLCKQVKILATYSKYKHKKNGHVHSSCVYAYKQKKNERRMMLLPPSCLRPYAFAYALEKIRLYRFLQSLGNLWYDRLQ